MRQKLRDFGRLLLVLNTLNSPVKSVFFYFISPENFDVVLNAVKNAVILLSLALKLVHSLKKKLAQIKIGQTLRKNDEVMLKEATKFITVVILLFGG